MTQEQALDILKTGANVFLTGEPGAGKTHTVNWYVRYLREHGIEPAITASTGIAATHIGGMTIHSWSGIGIKTKLTKSELERIRGSGHYAKRISGAKVLIIDEISMLSSATLDMVEAVCRKTRGSDAPFGGLQVVLVGDFFQLPPVVRRETADDIQTELFEEEIKNIFSYASSAWERARPAVCYLTEQHRQDDEDFLEMLSSLRRNEFTSDHLEYLGTRKVASASAVPGIVKLFSHNVDVDRVNDQMLEKLSGRPFEFEMRTSGKHALIEAMKRGCLSPEILRLKKGAAVMFTKNNPRKGFANGTLGAIESFDGESGLPVVKTHAGRLVNVEPMEWTVEENGKIRARLEQLPLRLAWAMTVHKSQGMSLDAAIMDLSSVFEYGQGYVALSRVRRFSGLHLLGWNARAFQVHPAILEQDETFRREAEQAGDMFLRMDADELKKQHENFLLASGGRSQGSASDKESFDTYFDTLLLWKRGKTLPEIAEARALRISTIVNHLEKLIAEKMIDRTEVMRVFSPDLKDALSEIRSAFRELDTRQLTPIFEKFQGVYSYDDLRLARILLDD